MKRKDIEKELKLHDSTILSFPNRGPWGDSKYRGNCSGWIQASLISRYNVQKMAELFSGSGTGYDVAKDMGIAYVGADLNPTPVRPGILCVNAITDDVPEEFLDADLLFMHPPYGAEINIPYAGNMYKDPTGELSRSDLGQMSWDTFMNTLNKIIMKYYSAMEPGARMAILMGDVRRNGKCYSMLADMVKPGELDQILVKAQHNCVSDGRTYAKRNFFLTEHEFLYVLKKVGGYIVTYKLPKRMDVDVRDSKASTWRDVVVAVMRDLKEADLDTIYKKIEGHEKCKNNPHYKDKIRQVLQQCNLFVSSSRGRWAMAA